jgi:replicative DNA helicase
VIEQRPLGSERAEQSVVGSLLRSEQSRIEVIGLGLEPEQFYFEPYKLLYDEIVERYYADESIDPLSVGEKLRVKLSQRWSISEREAVDRVLRLAKVVFDGSSSEHVRIVQQHAHLRAVMTACYEALAAAQEGEKKPDEIAGELSAAATRIVTGTMVHSESYPYGDLGRRWTRTQQEAIAARAAGVEVGARYGIKGLDQYVKGHRPGELFILGGDPGVGKSAISWAMARNFALSQMEKPPERRIGVLVLSLEMGEEGSSSRFAQLETHIEGDKLREGTLTRAELRQVAATWAQHRELPLWVNHSGSLRETQIKAVVVDHIRRHNVGVVIIDHFRFIKTDEHFRNRNDADEQIVEFLKANLAKDLNIAVTCLAHTTKSDGERPTMDDLRGSKMISAFADIVAFPFSPWRHASVHERDRGIVEREAFELIFAKVRQGAEGVADLWMDLSTQTIR